MLAVDDSGQACRNLVHPFSSLEASYVSLVSDACNSANEACPVEITVHEKVNNERLIRDGNHIDAAINIRKRM